MNDLPQRVAAALKSLDERNMAAVCDHISMNWSHLLYNLVRVVRLPSDTKRDPILLMVEHACLNEAGDPIVGDTVVLNDHPPLPCGARMGVCHSCRTLYVYVPEPTTYFPEDLKMHPDDVMTDGWYRVGKRHVPGEKAVQDAVRVLLAHIGEDPSRSGLVDTPKRVAKALREMTSGYSESPEEILSRTFSDDPVPNGPGNGGEGGLTSANGYDEVIILRGISFTAICEHHMLPFVGTMDVGYIPGEGGRVVGLSKLARLVDCFSRRLQMQERLTKQVACALMDVLKPQGAATICRASHSCMGCRGVKKPGAEMVTSCMLGIFRDDGKTRSEFLTLCKS